MQNYGSNTYLPTMYLLYIFNVQEIDLNWTKHKNEIAAPSITVYTVEQSFLPSISGLDVFGRFSHDRQISAAEVQM